MLVQYIALCHLEHFWDIISFTGRNMITRKGRINLNFYKYFKGKYIGPCNSEETDYLYLQINSLLQKLICVIKTK